MNFVECLLVGDGSIGKKCLIITYTTNKFPSEYIPTVLDCYTHTVLINDEVFSLRLSITPGQEDYDRFRPLSYQKADVFLVCFSVVDPNSFENIKTRWIPEITHNCPKTPFLLIGTKIDLRDDTSILQKLGEYKQKPINMEEGTNLAKEIKAIKYLECSALTQQGLKNIFEEAISVTLLKSPETQRKKSCCKLL